MVSGEQAAGKVRAPAPSELRRAADRGLLLERAAAALAHEGKNPLNNLVLHLQLFGEELRGQRAASPGGTLERHLQSMRDAIGRVDGLLRAFADFASPAHLPADVGQAFSRALLLFGYQARRAGVQVQRRELATLPVAAPPEALTDLAAHALLAAIALSGEGGRLQILLEARGPRAAAELRSEGGLPRRDEAAPHLEAARRLAAEAGAELSIDLGVAEGARLSLSFQEPR